MGTIIDSHCHAWPTWDDPLVPEPTRQNGWQQLVFQMDAAGVDKAVVVTGADAATYVTERSHFVRERFYMFPSVESYFQPGYHLGQAAQRLLIELERYQPKGFNHYEADCDDGSWFLSDDGRAYFDVAAEWNQIVSLHVRQHHMWAVRRLAREYPNTQLLLHHMGFPIDPVDGLTIRTAEVLACADLPNIHMKVSGLDIGSARPWDYPYADVSRVLAEYAVSFGAERLHWGSNFPMSQPSMTYRQTLECVREHSDFLTADELELVLGESLNALLARAG